METLAVTDMHTGGEPLRIVTGGYPAIPRGTILQKRKYVRDHLDHLRKILMFEPRGHFDMYGALLVEPDLPDADLAVLFLHNEGYSTMCGHAIVALGRYAVDQGLVERIEPETIVRIEAPCGLVTAHVTVENGKAGNVAFDSVPCFLFAGEQAVDLKSKQAVTYDIAYGGAFYALADCGQFGLQFGRDRLRDFVDAADSLTAAVKSKGGLAHPDHDDLAFLYGTILTDGNESDLDTPTRNICVFADSQVDRSPTGSGVSARLAAQFARGQVAIGGTRQFESFAGSIFTGSVVRKTQAGDHDAIIARVAGRAYYSGKSEFIVEPDDDLGQGFLLR